MTAYYEINADCHYFRHNDMPFLYIAEPYQNHARVYIKAEAEWPDVAKALKRRKIFYLRTDQYLFPSERGPNPVPINKKLGNTGPIRPGWWRMKR